VKLFDTTMAKLERSLDLRLEKQNVLAGNLANVDTPGYLPRDLDFDRAMAAAQAQGGGAVATALAPASGSTSEGHLSVQSGGPQATSAESFVKVAEGTKGGLDGNGVDLDKTMVELSRNALLYGAAAKATGKKLAILRYVATDGMG
jgi:flagellar basal-body rod protein FlgB